MSRVIGFVTTQTTSTVDESIWIRGTATSVAASSESTVLTYTVSGDDVFLDEITVSGTYTAEFRVHLNLSRKETGRIEITSPVHKFEYPPQKLVDGDEIQVTVIHNDTSSSHSFEASLKAYR